MKRTSLLLVALVFAGGIAAGCSKTDDVATPSVAGVDVAGIQGNAAKCTELAGTYATMFTSLVTGATDADKEKVAKEIDDVKAQVPDSVKADLTTISEGLASADGPQALAEYLASSDFTTANNSVTTYLTTECANAAS